MRESGKPHKIKIRTYSLLIGVLMGCLTMAGLPKYVSLPPSLDGSMMPIDFNNDTTGKWLPDSLRPIYATYVSRHGARYLSSAGKTEKLEKFLREESGKGNLSETGEDFQNLIKDIVKANTGIWGNWGDLTPLGLTEQRIMGSRVFGFVSPLHYGASEVKAISSYVPRCVMTMYEFTAELLRHNDSISVATDEGHKYNELLCCFIADKEYARYRKNGDWKHVYDDFMLRHVPTEPARRLLAQCDIPAKRLQEITMAMYEVLKANRAGGLPAPTTQWMTEKEYRACWETDNLSHYLRNTITPLSSLAARATAPLALQLIRDIDAAVGELRPNPVMNSYFGHAETLMPLLSLLRIPGCFALPLDYKELWRMWKVQEVTPLGANLLMVTAISPSGRPYVGMRLNGRVIRPMKGYPEILPWDKLREYWIEIMEGYGIPSKETLIQNQPGKINRGSETNQTPQTYE